MEFKIRNRNKQILRHAPNRNDIESEDGTMHTPDLAKTLDRLKSEYMYVEFFKLSINEAVVRAKAYGFQGLIVSSVDGDFAVLDRFGIPFENTIEFRSVDSNIQNAIKKQNVSSATKIKTASGVKQLEAFKCRSMGIKPVRDNWNNRIESIKGRVV